MASVILANLERIEKNYEKFCALLAECDKVKQAAWAECDKVNQAALAIFLKEVEKLWD